MAAERQTAGTDTRDTQPGQSAGTHQHDDANAMAGPAVSGGPVGPGNLLALQQLAGNQAVAGALRGRRNGGSAVVQRESTGESGPRIARSNRSVQRGTETKKPDTAALKEQLRERAQNLTGAFNFEMDTLQNNLAMVSKIVEIQRVPAFDVDLWFRNRMASELIEAVPFAPLAEGLKVAFDVYTKYEETAKAAQATKLLNQIRVFGATKSAELLLRQQAFALVKDMLKTAADSGDEQRMNDALKANPDPRSFSDILKAGETYRVALNQAFLARFVTMRAVIYDPSLSGVDPLEGHRRIEALRRNVERHPQADIVPMTTVPGGFILRRWLTPTSEHMSHLLAGLDDDGCGLSYDDLYDWYRTRPGASSEVRYAGATNPLHPDIEMQWFWTA